MQQEPELCAWTSFNEYDVAVLFTAFERLVLSHLCGLLIESVHVYQTHHIIIMLCQLCFGQLQYVLNIGMLGESRRQFERITAGYAE